MKKAISSILSIIGFISFLAALISAYYAVTSLIGLFVTLAFIMIGVLCLWISNRIKKHSEPKE